MDVQDLFLDFSGAQGAAPEGAWRIAAVRFAGVAILVAVPYALRYRRAFLERSAVQRAAILAILASVVMGADYVLFQVSASIHRAIAAGSLSIHHCYGATAAAVFVVSQVAAAIDLSRGDPGFMKWLLPPVLYLLTIGAVAGLAFDNAVQLAADTGRAAVLLALGLAARPWSPPGKAT